MFPFVADGKWHTDEDGNPVQVDPSVHPAQSMVSELMVLAARDKVSLHTQRYPLASFQAALDDLAAGAVRGRAILIP